ncbi:unnamed protein product [Musa acuminata subsp. malaccensis]|uniref:(wild Malaysian banana) hypothetical protein n=1 Tax=Musa acuminata subsp. malaccensis TaxID=214687 RepID=A0A804K0X0_MUSAM|nr:PREDICTED: scarecrow-like protein 4 isoform X2 [Musa acuminata subsp. malaccensis]CAG1858023.1 unnamed protein product [Musa acuminata subsp. malaccensis]
MAYMCAESGNLMAIAQQVIQQQRQQQQQLAASANPFSTSTQPWGASHHHQQHMSEAAFVIPDAEAAFLEPFTPDRAAGFEAPPGGSGHLDQAPFRLCDFRSSSAAVTPEFDTEEWMESLIGESPADNCDLMSDPWQAAAGASGALFADVFPSCSADINHPFHPASASGINCVLFSEPSEIAHLPPIQHDHQYTAVVALNPPGLASETPSFEPPELNKDPGAAAFASVRDEVPESNTSSPPLLESLLDCARLADGDPDLAAKSLIHVRESASVLGDPTERVAFYFAEALNRRLLGDQKDHSHPSTVAVPLCSTSAFDSSPEDFTLCYKVFNDACPYSKFAHLTANQAIVEATESAARIHIVDFGIIQGIQWAALLQALATRPRGKPSRVRVSGIPAPMLGAAPAASLTATGNRLRDFAAILDLDFEFDPILTPIAELTVSCFRIDSDEVVVVNFMLQLYHLLADSPESVERVLGIAKSLVPRVVTLGEYEASVNRGRFVERFKAALAYYAAVFDSLDPAIRRDSAERAQMERVLLGPRILGAVGAGDGPNRRERMEAKEEWRAVMERCGFEPVPVSNFAVSQAKLLLWNYDYSYKYAVLDSAPGFLTLAWGDRPLLTVSSWR